MNKKDGKERILKVAYKMLVENKKIEDITIRDIAKRANVGVGLINYHFKSKEYMLMEALGSELVIVAKRWSELANDESNDPKVTLKNMLLELINLGAEQLSLIEIAAKFELTEGDINTPLFILPCIMRITGKSEDISKIIAYSVISGIQSTAIKRKQFKEYVNIDIEKEDDREKYVDMIIKSIV
ncbi:MAG: TetR/AcrR family transcriptional regulator [Clostridiales bacterium]